MAIRKKMTGSAAVLVLVTVLLGGCDSAAEPSLENIVCPVDELIPGAYDRTVEVGGMQHRYHLYVPASYHPGEPAPLLFTLHGGAGNADNLEETISMKPQADALGFILVRAEGFNPNDRPLRTWNAGSCCGQAAAQRVDHVGAVRAMIDATAQEVCIDQRRVYATGHSNGGMMAYRLACDLADRIAAVAPNAAMLMTYDLDVDPPRRVFACEPSRPVPIFHMHGLADQCARFEGGSGDGLDRAIRPPVIESIDFWVARNGCSTEPVTTFQNGAATCVTYAGCDADATVTLCTIDGAGHVWPGSTRYPFLTQSQCGGQTTQDLVANDAIWDFFLAHPRPK